MENTALQTSTSSVGETTEKAAPYTVVYADWPRAKLEEYISSLPETATRIHIDGLPYLWIVEKVVTVISNLEALRITRTAERLFGARHRALLEGCGARLEIGYHRPEYAWKDCDIRRKGYPKKSLWLRNLSPEGWGLFQELLALEDADDARITSRYFCLNGEPYIPSHEVGKLFGYSLSCATSLVSFKIASVRKFLDDSIEAPSDICDHVKVLRQKIEAVRTARRKEEDERMLLEAFGILSLPQGLPSSLIALYCIVYSLFWEGELHGCLRKFARGRKALVLRYGIKDGSFRTYEAVGRELGRTGEAARKAEARAFKLLGIRICSS